MRKTPPLFRLLAWPEHRRTLCAVCHDEPKVTGGDYCGAACADIAAWAQAVA